MAVAATVKNNHNLEILFEQELLDFQFDAIIEAEFGHNHSAPKEVYGRSLSAIRKLGNVMIGDISPTEIIHTPEAAQAKVEFFTSVEEGFGTDTELGGGLEVRDFDTRPVIDGKVMAKDLKTPISEMTEDGLKCARKTLTQDKRFAPQYIRSYWDHQNSLHVDSMARGETNYNTRIVVSPFPEEAAAVSGDTYWRDIGYVPHLRRGFVQLYHFTDEGELLSGSLSFDGSAKARLRELFSQYDIEIPEDETTDKWLQYAITDTLSEEKAQALAIEIANFARDPKYKKTTNTVDVTTSYKPLMERVFNQSYVHLCKSLVAGAQTPELQELVGQLSAQANSFNDRYRSSLRNMLNKSNSFSDHDAIILHELLVYSTIEMMRSLHLKDTPATFAYAAPNFSLEQMMEANKTEFQGMLGELGAEGAKKGRTYSACGLSISLGDEAEDKNPQSAFGGTDKEKSEKKWMNCPFCKARVFDDPCAKKLTCWDCKAAVNNGKVTNHGNGGSKQRAKRAKERKQAKQQANEEIEHKEPVTAAVASQPVHDHGAPELKQEVLTSV